MEQSRMQGVSAVATSIHPPAGVLTAPFPYYGGKSRASALIWQLLGNVGNYV
jgi:hypothetical protein